MYWWSAVTIYLKNIYNYTNKTHVRVLLKTPLSGIHTVLQTLIVRVQQEVLEAVGDAVIRQKLQIVLIKLKLERVLVMNLE